MARLFAGSFMRACVPRPIDCPPPPAMYTVRASLTPGELLSSCSVQCLSASASYQCVMRFLAPLKELYRVVIDGCGCMACVKGVRAGAARI